MILNIAWFDFWILNDINQSSQLHFNITGNNAILTSTTEFTQISNMFLTKRQRDGEGQQLSGPGSNKLTKHCANNASHDVDLLPHSYSTIQTRPGFTWECGGWWELPPPPPSRLPPSFQLRPPQASARWCTPSPPQRSPWCSKHSCTRESIYNLLGWVHLR